MPAAPTDGAATRRAMRPYLTRHWPALAGSGGATVVAVAAELAVPWPLAIALDRVVRAREGGFELSPADWRLLAILAGCVLLIAAVAAVASFLADLLLKTAGERIVHELRTRTYEHLQRLSLAYHHRKRTGDLVTRLTGDVNAVGDLFHQTLGALLSAVLLLGGMVAVTFYVDPVLAVVALLVTPALALVTVVFQRRVRLIALRQRAKEGEIAATASETLGAMSVVKAFGTEQHEARRVEEMSLERRAAGVAVTRTESLFTGLVDVIGACATAAVLLVGVIRVASGAVTIGELTAFMAYTAKVYRPLRDIARTATRTQRAMARAERIAEILGSEAALPDTGRRVPPGRATTVALERVTFRYTQERPALGNLTLAVRPGERVALVGASGAGKSTVGALVARFYDPESGRVLIDGRDAREYPLSWVRRQVGIVLQETLLFSGSVADNIAYGLDVPAERIVAAARAAGADDFIRRMPEGYGTILGDRGVGLSGGQRQRLGIARVLLRDPSILLLDEPTTGLDAHSEAEVMEALDVLMASRTTIVVTHSIPLALGADRVVVIEAGGVVEAGPPERLLLEGGRFAALAARYREQESRRRRLRVARAPGAAS